jgi:outer membrane protein W
VGNTQAAIKDGAIGLSSMYVLASTPVESVNYDSGSGVVTARVRLAEGTTLNVGTQSNQVSQVGVRKRLGKHWAVETDVNQGSANAAGASASSTGTGTRGSLFFEYSSRY